MFRCSILVVCLTIFCSGNTSAQTSQLYQVSINPEASILSLSGARFQNHPGVEGNLDFFESEWFVESNTSAGASVTFTARPFINHGNPAYQRDVNLRLRRLRNDAGASWEFDDQVNRTRYSNGKLNAAVTMSTTSAEAATVSMRVRF